ncbi:MAG: inositol monophosphatase [Proteobacteria bacterium]|nr:MAG: inositol monophosphatase [Pseudomonadota bacterium]
MSEFVEDCIRACGEILDLIKETPHEKLCQDLQVGFGGDLSRFIDIQAERIFVKYLGKYAQIISEESGAIGEKSEFQIILDPIDGSDNFVSNIPYFGSSIALMKNKKCIKAFVCNFANGDVFYKENSFLKKTNLQKNQIKNEHTNHFSKCGIFESSYKSEIFFPILKQMQIKFRSLGALALSLSYARQVDFVLYEGELRAYDIEAGLYMCEDLYVKKDKNFIFVSKDKQIFDKIGEKLLKVG